jgi:hypothetical protein
MSGAACASEARAMDLADSVMTGTAPPSCFSLYLRPFLTTDHLPAQVLPSERRAGSDGRAEHLDLETILYRALDKRCELVGLGKPTDIADGAARVVADPDHWKAVAKRLISEAAFIILVPSAQRGTLWEVEELQRGGHLGKTIFVMPEQQRTQPDGVVVRTQQAKPWQNSLTGTGVTVFSPSRHHLNVAAEWGRARTALAGRGIALPSYNASGAFFTVSADDGKPTQVAPAPLSLLVRQEHYVRRALAALGALPRQNHDRHDDTDMLTELEVSAGATRKSRELILALAMDIYATFDRPIELAAAAERVGRVTRGYRD